MMICRDYRQADDVLLREMLFEAVFWSRTEADRPTLEEGLSYDYMKHVLVDFGKRKGDLAVVAEVDGVKAGAAFVRCWTDDQHIRGYLSPEIPVLVIGVDRRFRRQGVGGALIEALKEAASSQGTARISLCVTKTNVAFHLYAKHGFEIVEDIGDSCNMIWMAQAKSP